MGQTKMIDVSAKQVTMRIAKATATIKLGRGIVRKIKNKELPKGDVLSAATIAGIMAAKKTPELIPLCHSIGVEQVGLDFKFKVDALVILATVKSSAKTGVEMEALTAVAVAALTVYDMCKMFSQAIELTNVYLLEKRGGKSGVYQRAGGR